MPVKIRLQRHGKKGKPFYWLVAADSRAKRDGKFLEKLGTYNPNTNPATIDINIDKSVSWLQNGAQPSDTAKRILSYKGVLLKHHLLGGVRKGALTEEQVEERFTEWLENKDKSISEKTHGLDKAKAEAKAKALKAEKEVAEKRAQAATEAEAPAEEEAVEAASVESAEDVAVEEQAAEETPAEEVAEAETPAGEETAAAPETTEADAPTEENAEEADKKDKAAGEEA